MSRFEARAHLKGRCLLHIPFGISAVRESQVQPPIDRSKQAG
jgi:hypothetical protein